jgi:glucosamine-phosphate N-acetyltransferase
MSVTVQSPPELQICELFGPDLANGFLETLESLSQVRLTPAGAAEVLRTRLRMGVKTYVAKIDGKVVGTCALLLEQKFIHSGGWVGHIEDVVVHKECQKKGIGSALVEHAVGEAKKRGCYKVILDCFEHLVPFYDRFGFRVFNIGMRCDC